MVSKKTDRIIKIVLVIAAIITVIGLSYALLTATTKGEKSYALTGNNLKVYLDESKNLSDIMGENTIPVADYVGESGTAYTFSIKNDESIDLSYSIYLVEDENSDMPINGIRYNLIKKTSNLNKTSDVNEKVDATGNLLHTDTIYRNTTDEYELRIWMGENVGNEAKGKKFSAHIEIEAIQNISTEYVDNSGANKPNLATNMIPVTYDGETNSWVKANVNKEWYNYDEQWWANAVTVSETNRETYVNATAGTPISMEDINTMWVWIPRYEYETIISTTATEIKVNFVPGNRKGTTNNYITHPAFTFGDKELEGIWVAKFEASSDQSCTATAGDIDKGCDLTTLKVQVKPNVTSWRGIRVSTLDLNSRAMNDENNIYGFDSTEVDTHAMKNLEWGSVAYLSQSKYGKYGNPNYEGTNKEIYQNKSSSFITGMSNGTPSTDVTNTQVTYDVEGIGIGASTTGTIYGIYDMSGGAYEYVMGVMKEIIGANPLAGTSGFVGKRYANGSFVDVTGRDWVDSKYYDLYDYSEVQASDESYSRYKHGDATTETKIWYNDSTGFIYVQFPWFIRGGDYDKNRSAGIFDFNASTGVAFNTYSFRPVLVLE